jgi:hypothetical protein
LRGGGEQLILPGFMEGYLLFHMFLSIAIFICLLQQWLLFVSLLVLRNVGARLAR